MHAYIAENGQRMIAAGNMCSPDGVRWFHYAGGYDPLPLTPREREDCELLLRANLFKRGTEH